MPVNPKAKLLVKVDTSNLRNTSKFKSLNSILKEMGTAINTGARKGAEQTAQFILRRQSDYLRIGGHRHTGALMGSLSITNGGGFGGGLYYEIGSTLTGYSPSVIEYGRGEVRPVKAKCLHFTTKYGEEVFTTYSKPFPADPYVAPSALEGLQQGVKFISDAINYEL